MLRENLKPHTSPYVRKNTRRKKWHKVLMMISIVVVFCTTYALILPAITLEKRPTCGIEEHTHSDACTQPLPAVLSCAEAAHSHTPDCLDELGYVICGNSEYLVHSHDEFCHSETGELICTLAEAAVHEHTQECWLPATSVPAHIHDAGCYETVPGELLCTLEEVVPHMHSDEAGCYVHTQELICTLEETDGHQHTDACFDEEENLICAVEEQPAHSHGEDCYLQNVQLVCTEEETEGHLHGEGCYAESQQILICELPDQTEPEATGEPVLICGYGEAVVHQHNQECFLPDPDAEVLFICGMEEHIHNDLLCFADFTADLESEDTWLRTLPELSGNPMEDILTVAASQLGYQESTKNYVVVDDTPNGYTRYGQWYGDPYGEWCAMFTSFCLNYAGVSSDIIPYESNCSNWVDDLSAPDRDLFRPAVSRIPETAEPTDPYMPKPGDLVFFDKNGNNLADHVGFVSSVEDEILHTIEGNCDNAVRRMDYALTDPTLLGYGMIPETEPGILPPVLVEQTLLAEIYTDETMQQLADDETLIRISGTLPEGASARAYPVVLDTGLFDGADVLLAYDITIVDHEGNPIDQSEEGTLFTVSIQPPGWTPSEDENYNIYYIPEEGTPEMMDSESADDAVSFTTPHFSTYALTATGTQATVYLNGASGNDSRAGTSASTAVKTMAKALTLVKDGGTIYITGTVTVSDEQEWDLESTVTVKRNSGFTGPLVTVANGGSLKLKNITINGGSGTPSSSKIASTTSYASGSAKAPLIVVNSGGSLWIDDGAVLEYNSNKPDLSGNYFKENGYVGQGGAVYCQGNLTMTGGTIRYCEAESGGGIYVESANTSRITFNLSGGTITYNYARDIVSTSYRKNSFHRNAGGGIYVGDYVTMNMSGGTVSYNQSSREGGGISLGWLNRSKGAAINSFITTLNMTGGTLDHNTATSTGGGLNITAGREAYISAGYFTNNTANGNEYQHTGAATIAEVYSGGGIYLDAQQLDSNGDYAGKPGYALIHRVLVTNNSSPEYCGGVATCSTSTSYISSNLQMDGTLIFGNKTGTSTNATQLSLDGTVNLVGDTALGGIAYNWNKTYGSYSVNYKNSLSESNASVKAAMKLATVIVTGNTAFDGGGIGCNGHIEVGGEEKPTSITISITKKWDDDKGSIPHPDYVTVQIYQDGKPYGDPIRIQKQTDSNGNESWPTVYVDKLPSGHEYTIRELEEDQYRVTITQNGNNFTITNSIRGFTVIKKWEGDNASDRPGSITVQLKQDGEPYGDPVQLTATNDWSHMWLNLPKGFTYTVEEVEIPDGYYFTSSGLNADGVWEITNTKIPLTSISVEKRWVGGDPLSSVTVQLLSNGVMIREAVLNADNGWFHKWDNLPTVNERNQPLSYTIQEVGVKGYESSIRPGTDSDANQTWTAVTGLASGQDYLLVSSSGALSVTDGSLAWTDVSGILTSGREADASQLWRYDGQLQNGGGQSLELESKTSNYFSYTYTYKLSSSGSAITFSQDGYISAKGQGFLSTVTRYFGSINTDGTATAVESNGSPTKFTAYVRTVDNGNWGDKHYILTNTKLPDSIDLRFAKYAEGASKEPTLLAGAELELYQVSASGDVTIPGTEQKGVLIRKWTSGNATGADGGIHVEELYSGTYYLIETVTPIGHIGLSGPVIFEVLAEEGTVNLIECPYELTLGTGQEIEFPIYNSVAYALPETGGIGTGLYTAGGMLLILMAACLLAITNSKRKRA